jgi:hypothetical protein
MIYIGIIGGIGVCCSLSTMQFKFKPPHVRYLIYDSEDNAKINKAEIKNPNNYLINGND